MKGRKKRVKAAGLQEKKNFNEKSIKIVEKEII